jgi:transposase
MKNKTQRIREEYDSISTQTRRMLIQLINEHKMSIRKASKMLKIKYSTGKTLVQLYRKTGRVDRIK